MILFMSNVPDSQSPETESRLVATRAWGNVDWLMMGSRAFEVMKMF